MFDLLMNEYHVSLAELQTWTREQIFLFCEKIEHRIKDERRFQVQLHQMEMKEDGLDTSGAVAIEDVIDKQNALKEVRNNDNRRVNFEDVRTR
jgi:hypothetical protein